MRRYIYILNLAAIMLIAFAACYQIEGAPSQVQAELAQDAHSQTISWQDAYAEKLRYHAHNSTNPASEWRFMLHDMNQDGIPQLFLIRYYTGLREHYEVYTFADGEILRLKSSLGLGNESNSGIILPPDGTTGIIRVMDNSMVRRYDMMALYGTTLTRVVSGTFSEIVGVFSLDVDRVTQEEFEDIFGKRDQRVWLALHEITEANIQDLVFGRELS